MYENYDYEQEPHTDSSKICYGFIKYADSAIPSLCLIPTNTTLYS